LGDLRNGRTVHENGPLFARLGVPFFFLVSPPTLAMPEDVIAQMEGYGTKVEVCENIESALRYSDILYDTRIQGKRFEDQAEYERVRGDYVVDAALLARTKPTILVMHPLPRVDELADDVINSPNCLCWEQVCNGVFVRMALLALLTGAI
jgi:aspartate carbamoyltransferase catalytic subunit